MEIRGFEAVRAFCGFSENLMRRSLKLYGFPQPVRLEQDGSALHRIWCKRQVIAWLVANQDEQWFISRGLYKVIKDLKIEVLN